MQRALLKKNFLNTVYQRFFQGYSPKEADTHGIVYTPQPIVNFMVRSVQEILQKEFGRSLGDKGVHILDPFVGTGNFIVHIMQEIKATDLPYKYENELHCNEVMLLPYYIASMNIEHAYFDRTGEYKAFPGICLVDTFDMASQKAFSEKNTERIDRQLRSEIFVAIGNPPYNAWQVNENDNNKNRKYDALDDRVSETYAKASRATNKSALSDPYVKAIRWASDRIKKEGIVALVTNNGFVDGLAGDGMRMHLARDFDEIYILDLGGNVRKNPKLSGTTHNVFGIQVGVSINIFVRHDVPREQRRCKIFYARTDEFWTRWQKYNWLDDVGERDGVNWEAIIADRNDRWLVDSAGTNFESLLPLGPPSTAENALFNVFSNALKTNRDVWAYQFDAEKLSSSMASNVDFYNSEVDRWKRTEEENRGKLDDFVRYDDTSISWTRDLKADLRRERVAEFSSTKIRNALYRPFTSCFVFLDRILNEEVYGLPLLFPLPSSENKVIVVTDVASRSPFSLMATDRIPDIHLCASTDTFQCFPFYTYAEDGTHRRENITDWALEQFRAHYHDPSITKWDIFHYTYAVLHHPEYRERYAANLRRELPRIPFANAKTNCHPEEAESLAKRGTPDEGPMHSAVATKTADESIGPSARKKRGPQDDNAENSSVPSVVQNLEVFRELVKAGQRLAEIHVHYEQQPEYPLTKKEKAGEKLDYRVTKMRLGKDKTALIYNQFLTLSEIPKETYDYRLGNRSALEWVIDQYQVSTDKRSGITNDRNRADDPQYILRLIGQVITVSLETVEIVKSLPPLGLVD